MLDVADLDEAVRLGGGVEDLRGLLEGDADRLLDEEVDALGQQRQRDGGVMIGRTTTLTASQFAAISSRVRKRRQLCLAQISAARASFGSKMPASSAPGRVE